MNKSLFVVAFLLLVTDRILTLTNFAFLYTDIDQVILWNGALDYSKGVFHEPFFYGQSYNYMLEAFLAVPLVWFGVPVYQALPIISTILAVFPYLFISICLFRNKQFFWAQTFVLLPVILPLGYNLLTTIPRGFLQANLFLPFVALPLISPSLPKKLTVFFLFASLSFVANQSSLVLIFPIGVFLLLQSKRLKFFLHAFVALPVLLVDAWAKYYVNNRSNKIVHQMAEVNLDYKMLLKCLKRGDIFQNLFPFVSDFGFMYLVVFIVLLVYAIKKGKNIEFWFVFSAFAFTIVTFFIPKVQEYYDGAGVFYHSSRFYLALPFLFLIFFYTFFRRNIFNNKSQYIVLIVAVTTFCVKQYNEKDKIKIVVDGTTFPIDKIENLKYRQRYLKSITNQENADLILHAGNNGWSYLFDAYTFKFFADSTDAHIVNHPISALVYLDRRTWLYDNIPIVNKNLLLNGFDLPDSLLMGYSYKRIDENRILLLNNNIQTVQLMKLLGIHYGAEK